MKKAVHRRIAEETIRSLELSSSNYQLVLDGSVEPDQLYERAIRERESLEEETVERIKKEYGEIDADSLLSKIKTELSKYGSIATTKLKSVGSRASNYVSWALNHGAYAKSNAVKCFREAEKLGRDERLIKLGWCLHFIADTGTPFHRKSIKEIFDNEEDDSKRLTETFSDNLVKFSKSAIYGHKRSEEEILFFWNTERGEEKCVSALNRGFKAAARKEVFGTFDEASEEFEKTLEEVEETATLCYKELDEYYDDDLPIEEKEISEEFRELIIEANLKCLVKIGKASYIVAKPILLKAFNDN